MSTELAFEVAGVPIAQGSKTVYQNKRTKKPILVESAGDRLKAWRANITLTARRRAAQAGWQAPGAARVDLLFYLPRPKSHYGTGRNAGTVKQSAPSLHTVKPDGDKLTRAVLDALTDAGVLRDDSNVAAGGWVKYYTPAEQGTAGSPGAEVVVRVL